MRGICAQLIWCRLRCECRRPIERSIAIRGRAGSSSLTLELYVHFMFAPKDILLMHIIGDERSLLHGAPKA